MLVLWSNLNPVSEVVFTIKWTRFHLICHNKFIQISSLEHEDCFCSKMKTIMCPFYPKKCTIILYRRKIIKEKKTNKNFVLVNRKPSNVSCVQRVSSQITIWKHTWPNTINPLRIINWNAFRVIKASQVQVN